MEKIKNRLIDEKFRLSSQNFVLAFISNLLRCCKRGLLFIVVTLFLIFDLTFERRRHQFFLITLGITMALTIKALDALIGHVRHAAKGT